MDMNLQELVILVLILIAVGGVFWFCFKSIVKVALAILLCVAMYIAVFQVLPKVLDISEKQDITVEIVVDQTIEEFGNIGVNDKISGVIDQTGQFIENNKESWLTSLSNLLKKLFPSKSEDDKLPIEGV